VVSALTDWQVSQPNMTVMSTKDVAANKVAMPC
jgi:hypothetical protein